MPECPYCGRWFKTKRGLQQHIAKSHSVKMPFGGRMIDPSTIDIFGKMERESKRASRRKKKSFSLW